MDKRAIANECISTVVTGSYGQGKTNEQSNCPVLIGVEHLYRQLSPRCAVNAMQAVCSQDQIPAAIRRQRYVRSNGVKDRRHRRRRVSYMPATTVIRFCTRKSGRREESDDESKYGRCMIWNRGNYALLLICRILWQGELHG